MNCPYRSELPPRPARLDKLPLDGRGYPVPWFVAWMIDGQPEFRIMDGRKIGRAVRERRCWVCGEPLASNRMTFLIGPMCVINRVSSEPPSHPECAEYSVRACPFLARPNMTRRENDLPEKGLTSAGHMIARNPGAICYWTTTGFRVVRANSGVLFSVFLPTEVRWYREGRAATRAEVMESIETGLPILEAAANTEGPAACRELRRMMNEAEPYWPKEVTREVSAS